MSLLFYGNFSVNLMVVVQSRFHCICRRSFYAVEWNSAQYLRVFTLSSVSQQHLGIHATNFFFQIKYRAGFRYVWARLNTAFPSHKLFEFVTFHSFGAKPCSHLPSKSLFFLPFKNGSNAFLWRCLQTASKKIKSTADKNCDWDGAWTRLQ